MAILATGQQYNKQIAGFKTHQLSSPFSRSIISFPHQIAILQHYIKRAAEDSECGGPEKEKWARLISQQKLSIEAQSDLESPDLILKGCTSYPSSSSSTDQNGPDFPPFIDGDKSSYKRYPNLGGIGFVDWTWEKALQGFLGDFSLTYLNPNPISKQVWDASVYPPVRLLSSAHGKNQIPNNIAAQTCFENMSKIDTFFRNVFWENPVDNTRTPMTCYINELIRINFLTKCKSTPSSQTQSIF